MLSKHRGKEVQQHYTIFTQLHESLNSTEWDTHGSSKASILLLCLVMYASRGKLSWSHFSALLLWPSVIQDQWSFTIFFLSGESPSWYKWPFRWKRLETENKIIQLWTKTQMDISRTVSKSDPSSLFYIFSWYTCSTNKNGIRNPFTVILVWWYVVHFICELCLSLCSPLNLLTTRKPYAWSECFFFGCGNHTGKCLKTAR